MNPVAIGINVISLGSERDMVSKKSLVVESNRGPIVITVFDYPILRKVAEAKIVGCFSSTARNGQVVFDELTSLKNGIKIFVVEGLL